MKVTPYPIQASQPSTTIDKTDWFPTQSDYSKLSVLINFAVDHTPLDAVQDIPFEYELGDLPKVTTYPTRIESRKIGAGVSLVFRPWSGPVSLLGGFNFPFSNSSFKSAPTALAKERYFLGASYDLLKLNLGERDFIVDVGAKYIKQYYQQKGIGRLQERINVNPRIYNFSTDDQSKSEYAVSLGVRTWLRQRSEFLNPSITWVPSNNTLLLNVSLGWDVGQFRSW